MAGIGFVMILVNSLDYIFGWGNNFAILGILGLVFVAVEMNITKKSKLEVKK